VHPGFTVPSFSQEQLADKIQGLNSEARAPFHAVSIRSGEAWKLADGYGCSSGVSGGQISNSDSESFPRSY
jgi:hypothetical protein